MANIWQILAIIIITVVTHSQSSLELCPIETQERQTIMTTSQSGNNSVQQRSHIRYHHERIDHFMMIEDTTIGSFNQTPNPRQRRKHLQKVEPKPKGIAKRKDIY